MLATPLVTPALAAGETTAERLLNVAAEPQNWVTHHKDYAATDIRRWMRSTPATRGPGKLVWKMDPGTEKDYWSGAVSCCGVNNAASRCGRTR